VRCDVRQWDGRAKTLLLDVCGVAGGASGTGLFALMGPSGSGKSTLLDVLSGRSVRGHVTGSIRLDGVVTTEATRRSICGYVLQEEVLPGTQTVWEYLLFHASLRLPSSTTTPANRVRRVRDTVAAMRLQRVAASVIGDVFVRGLSGGERRRLAIGAELLAAPRLLLLDEPTTGLDSASAGAIVDLLAALGREGGVGPSTVLVSLHQPSLRIFRTLERVLLLCDGRAVRFSSASLSLPQPPSLPRERQNEVGGLPILTVCSTRIMGLPAGVLRTHGWLARAFRRHRLGARLTRRRADPNS
jgi:ABC-type multidrug transport system ATPase subunit